MIDLSTTQHHPAIEELTSILCNRTQNDDRSFFRVVSAYYLSMLASTMRAKLSTEDRGEVSINTYAIALSESGSGKGYSVGIMEEEVMRGFRRTFVEHTLPVLAEQNMWKIASRRAARNGTEDQFEFDKISKEYADTGAYAFAFDSGSSPAIKQVRQKLLIADAGSINLQVDEIGLNLLSSVEALTVYLELYDQGKTKNKLTKSTSENRRAEEIEGKTPANMLLFGTPSKLLDGGKTEEELYSMLDTGYARRCIFAMGTPIPASLNSTPREVYERLRDPGQHGQVQKWANHFATLADPDKYGWTVTVPEDVAIELLTYRIDCEAQARALNENEHIRKAELSHRYFKTLKLAGAFAFIEESFDLTMGHLHAAMKLVEESGTSFQSLLRREKAYAKLARYIASTENEVTHADLLEALPFYKSGNSARSEMISLATAWGYKQHIVIKKRFVDGIEFFSGETLQETSLEEISLSYSDDFAYHYGAELVPFLQLHQLTQAPDMHWANHAFTNEHRAEENVIQGFNMVVIDVDGGVSMQAVHDLLKDYVFMTYTTKRHTPENNRFRLLLPINYQLKMDQEDYREFVKNLATWLPFEIDPASYQRSKKWLSNHKGTYHYNTDGVLLDALPFIPKTTKNEQYQKATAELASLDALERWFAQRFAEGSRNAQMIRFALALVDCGMTYNEVETRVMAFNKKLNNGLPEDELRRTVLVTVAKKCQQTTP